MKLQLMVLSGMMLLSGCVAPDTTGTGSGPEPAAAVNAVRPAGGGMLSGLQRKNYAMFIENFSAELRQAVPEPAFEKLCADLQSNRDSIKSWNLLDSLERGGVYRTEIWKVAVERATRENTVTIDRLFFVTVAPHDGGESVIGFRFDTLF
ncbi:MAG: hypothetical protein AB7F40_10465 [Victivallaceae bacterium]|nr:hypothetical protein [Victivallaceae bacterium]